MDGIIKVLSFIFAVVLTVIVVFIGVKEDYMASKNSFDAIAPSKVPTSIEDVEDYLNEMNEKIIAEDVMLPTPIK